MESVKMEPVKTTKKVERTILDSNSVEKINLWVNQIQKELGDTVNVTQKSLVNFIIQAHSVVLSADEVQKIKSENFDLIKALKKATDEAIKAKQAGNEMQLDEIINLIQTPGVSTISTSKKPRRYKTKNKTSTDTNSENELNLSEIANFKPEDNVSHKLKKLDSNYAKNDNSISLDFS